MAKVTLSDSGIFKGFQVSCTSGGVTRKENIVLEKGREERRGREGERGRNRGRRTGRSFYSNKPSRTNPKTRYNLLNVEKVSVEAL